MEEELAGGTPSDRAGSSTSTGPSTSRPARSAREGDVGRVTAVVAGSAPAAGALVGGGTAAASDEAVAAAAAEVVAPGPADGAGATGPSPPGRRVKARRWVVRHVTLRRPGASPPRVSTPRRE